MRVHAVDPAKSGEYHTSISIIYDLLRIDAMFLTQSVRIVDKPVSTVSLPIQGETMRQSNVELVDRLRRDWPNHTRHRRTPAVTAYLTQSLMQAMRLNPSRVINDSRKLCHNYRLCRDFGTGTIALL